MSIIHPVKIRGLLIPSNVFFAPINPGYASAGVFSKQYSNFFLQYSGKRIGICYIGNVALQSDWCSNKNTTVLYHNTESAWESLVKNISCLGSVPGIQLAWKPKNIEMQQTFLAKDIWHQVKLYKDFYVGFCDFESVVNQFIEDIAYCAKLGFSVIQIHAAHGYALSLLLSKTISGCNDPENTKGARLLQAISAALADRNFILDIRVSLFEGLCEREEELEYKMKLFRFLKKCGFDMISLSNGFYNIDKTMIYPPKKDGAVLFQEVQAICHNFPDIMWNLAGNMECVLTSQVDCPSNLTFSLGRQLLVDAASVAKMEKGEPIIPCVECNRCHYYSFGLDGIQSCI